VSATLETGRSKLLKCGNCGVVFVDPVPTREKYASYFAEEYLRNDELLEGTFEEARDRILSRVAREVRRRKQNGGNILDVGCAGGYFLQHYFNGGGWKLHGLEPSRLGVRRAEEKGIRMYNGNAHSVDLPRAFFDVDCSGRPLLLF
jgi:SAM-dependent methyltransferase